MTGLPAEVLGFSWALYALTGMVAGTLAGLLGVGGGAVIVPALTYCFEAQGFPPGITVQLALGTSLATILFTSLSSVRAHHHRKAVSYRIVWRITPGILLGTYLGSGTAARLPPTALKTFFAVFLLAVTAQMLSGAEPRPSRRLPGRAATAGAGLLIGLVSSLVGIGGGSLSVPFMVWCNVEMRQAIGTSAAIGFPIALAGTVGYVVNGLGRTDGVSHALGYVYLPALAGVALLSVLAAPLGVRWAHRLDPRRARRVFALFLLAMACRMIWDVVG